MNGYIVNLHVLYKYVKLPIMQISKYFENNTLICWSLLLIEADYIL